MNATANITGGIINYKNNQSINRRFWIAQRNVDVYSILTMSFANNVLAAKL